MVYVFGAEAGPVKIGKTCELIQRAAELKSRSRKAGAEHHLLFASVPVADALELEERTHARLASHRTEGEWFSVEASIAIEAIGWALAQAGQPFEGKRSVTRGRPKARHKMPPAMTIRLTHEQLAAVDSLYAANPRRTKAQIVRDAIEAGLCALSAV